MNLSTTERNN